MRRLILLAVAGSVGFGPFAFSDVPSEPDCRDVAVIAHQDNPATSIRTCDLRDIYTGQRTRWPSGTKIVVITGPPGSVIEETFNRRLRLGEAGPATLYGLPVPFRPLRLEGQAAVRYVRLFPGAIAYVWADEVPAQVKPLQVDGLAAADDADCADHARNRKPL